MHERPSGPVGERADAVTHGAMLTNRGVIYPWQCDHMGHLNVRGYVGEFDEASWHLFALLGLPAERLRAEKRGMAAVEQHITYHRELRAGDVISIYSDIISLRQRVLIFRHRMLSGASSEPAAETEITGVHLDLSTRRATALPEDVIRNGRVLMNSASSPRPGGAPDKD